MTLAFKEMERDFVVCMDGKEEEEEEDVIYDVFKYLDDYGLGMSIGLTPKEAIRLFILIYENTCPNKLIDL